jgi:hypothetical protein
MSVELKMQLNQILHSKGKYIKTVIAGKTIPIFVTVSSRCLCTPRVLCGIGDVHGMNLMTA